MFQDLKKNVKDISDEKEVREYLKKLPRGKLAVVGVLDPSEQACARRSDTSGRPSFSSCPQYKENPPVSAAYAS